jgi:hypothetical protein
MQDTLPEISKAKRVEGVFQVVELLPGNHKVLSSNSSATNTILLLLLLSLLLLLLLLL